MRRRPLLGAAVVGGVAYHAGKKRNQAAQQEADQNAQIADLQDQRSSSRRRRRPRPPRLPPPTKTPWPS